MTEDKIINIFLSGSEISLLEGETNEIMELNDYDFVINTSENLHDHVLLMKKYGQTNFDTLKPLKARIERLASFTLDDVSYWGKLIFSKEEEGKFIYEAPLVTYEPIFSNTVIPNKQKITDYSLKDVGKIEVEVKYEKDNNIYKFILRKIEINDFLFSENFLSLMENKLTPVEDEQVGIKEFVGNFEKNVLENITLNMTENIFSIQKDEKQWNGMGKDQLSLETIFLSNINYSNNDMDFPEPPLIENKLIIDKDFPMSGKITVKALEEKEDSFLEDNDENIDEDTNDGSNNENNDESNDVLDENNVTSEFSEEDDNVLDTEDDEISLGEEQGIELKVEFQTINLEFSTYDNENGNYYYKHSFNNWTYPLENNINLISLDTETIEEITDDGTTKIINKINNVPYKKKTFNGELIVIFDENNFDNYSIELNGTISYFEDKEINNSPTDEEDIESPDIDENDSNDELDTFTEDIISSYFFTKVISYEQMNLDFSEFSFEEEKIDKTKFDAYNLTDKYSIMIPEVNSATGEKNLIVKEVERFTIGVAKLEENGRYSYMSNALEFEVKPSFFSNPNWSNLNYFVNDSNYIIGYYNSSDKEFYKEYSNNTYKTIILGRANVIYIDKNTSFLNKDETTDQLTCYEWDPVNGFTELQATEGK